MSHYQHKWLGKTLNFSRGFPPVCQCKVLAHVGSFRSMKAQAFQHTWPDTDSWTHRGRWRQWIQPGDHLFSHGGRLPQAEFLQPGLVSPERNCLLNGFKGRSAKMVSSFWISETSQMRMAQNPLVPNWHGRCLSQMVEFVPCQPQLSAMLPC